MSDRRGGRLLVGFVLLHVLCCGLPLLGAGGVLGGAGALLTSPLLLVVGGVLVAAAVLFALHRACRAIAPPCCPVELPRTAARAGEHR